MKDEVLEFAEEQTNVLLNKFIIQGFCYLDFPEATMYITVNTFAAMGLLKNGVLEPTQKQLKDESISACDDIIKSIREYKEKLMKEEV